MRSGGIFIPFILLLLALSQPAFASHPFERQGHEIRTLERHVWGYHDDYDEYPVTDNQSTWYEKIVANSGSSGLGIRKTTLDGRFPLDYYGYPLILEPPSATNGNQIVIRAVGQNGVDDFGTLDDWDSRSGPNLGYWYKKRWPAAYRRAWVCGVLGVIGLAFIAIRIKQVLAKFIYASLWIGLLAGVVLPIGFDRGLRGHGSASIDPRWIDPISGVGVLLLTGSIILLIFSTVCTVLHRRSQRLDGAIPCTECDYDLRGTIAASIDRCPECGEPVSAFQNRNFNPPAPPSP